MRPFSEGGTGKSINLLNIRRGRLIRSASIKNQCAKDYFYGKDLEIEIAMQPSEGRYANIIRDIINGNKLIKEDLEFLRDFCYLQFLRTDVAVRRTMLAQSDMHNLIFDGEKNINIPSAPTEKEIIRYSMGAFVKTKKYISDLKVCILYNITNTHFVTSDDPAIQANRFHAQRVLRRGGGVGIINSWLMLLLPITPRHLIASYDGDVYTVPDKIGYKVEVTNDNDVIALNEMQFLKASQNIYFHDWDDGPTIKETFDRIEPQRPKDWHKLHYAVRDDQGDDKPIRTYHEVHTEVERREAREALIHLESVLLRPTRWCSKIKFRHKPIYINTKSGSGLIRRGHAGRKF